MLVQNDFGVWQIDLTVNGERCRKSTRTKDKSLAQKLHALTEAEMLKGAWGITKKSYSLKDAFEAAIKSHWKGSKAEFKVVQNWRLLTDSIDNSKPLLDSSKDVSSVTAETIRDLTIALSNLGNSPATINRKMAVVRTLLNLCVEWGKLTHSPKIKALKEPPSRHRVLTSEEEVSMMLFFGKHCPEQAGLYEFLLSSACRLSEVLKLTWFDVDFKNSVVKLTDTKSGETLHKPMTNTMKRVLEARKGLPVPFPHSIHTLEDQWDRFRVYMGMENDDAFVIHCLRHTCASRLVQSGMDLKRVQAWLGHKSYTTTLKYAQLSEGHLSDVVSALNGKKQFDYSLSTDSQSGNSSTPVVLLRM